MRTGTWALVMCVAAVLAMALVAPGRASADTVAVTVTVGGDGKPTDGIEASNGAGSHSSSPTLYDSLGYRFSVNQTVVVTKLGLFDFTSVGTLQGTQSIYLYDSSHTLLASAPITAGTKDGQCWWTSLGASAVLLSSGMNYDIMVGSSNGWLTTERVWRGCTTTWGGSVNLVHDSGLRQGDTSSTDHYITSFGSYPGGYFGPNFQYVLPGGNVTAKAQTGAWATPGEWVGGAVPGAADTAFLNDMASNVEVAADAPAYKLDVTKGTLTVDSTKTLTVASDTFVRGNDTEYGTLNLTGKLATATLQQSGGCVNLNGTTGDLISNTAAVTVSGGSFDLKTHSETVGAVTVSGGEVKNGTLTGTSYAVSAGAISASLAGSGVVLTKSGTGSAELTGTNSYSGATTIQGGALHAVEGAGLPTASTLNLAGGVLESSGTLSRTLGAGSGNVCWTASTNGGFAARGAELDVALNSGGPHGWLTWNSSNFVSTGNALLLGSTTATNLVDLQNPIDFAGAVRTVQVDDNLSSTGDSAKLSYKLTNGGFNKTGGGLLEISSTANDYTLGTTVTAGTLKVTGKIGDVTVEAGAKLTGNGQVGATLIKGALNNPGIVAPGNSPGTLDVQGNYTMNDGSLYEWQLASTGSYDKIAVTGNLTLNSTWTLEILKDAGFSGSIASTDTFNLFTYTGSLTTALNGYDLTSVAITLGSGLGAQGWNIDNAMVKYDGSLSDGGRVYLTGLQVGTGGGAVPEPAALGLIGLVPLLLRSRKTRRVLNGKETCMKRMIGVLPVLILVMAFMTLVIAPPASADTGSSVTYWTHVVSGDGSGQWGTASNWYNNTLPSSTMFYSADFGSHNHPLNITTDSTVTLDGTRTCFEVFFGDSDGTNNWFLNTGSGGALTFHQSYITVDNGITATINAQISDSASFSELAKLGTGKLVLTNNSNNIRSNNAFEIRSGTLTLANSAAIGTADSTHKLMPDGGTLEMYTTGTMNAYQIKGSTSTSGTIMLNRSSSASTVSYTLGALEWKASTLYITKGGNVTDSASLTVGATTLSGAAIFDTAANTTLTLGAMTGNYNFTKQDTGTMVLGAAASSARTGTTYINGGTLQFVNNGFSTGAGYTLDFGGGTLQYASGNTQDVSALIASSTTGAISIDTGTNSVTFASALASSNTAGLTKLGSGTLTLGASNAYTGATTISAGTLLLSGSGSVNTSSGITINGTGARLITTSSAAITAPITLTSGTLGGTGTIGTAVAVGANGILSPGTSPGTQDFSAGLAWNGGGSELFEINDVDAGAGSGWDLITVSGGTMTVGASSGNPFNILLTSLTLGNIAGDVNDFSDSTSYTWKMLDAASAISGFTGSEQFDVDTTAFSDDFTGSFSVVLGNTVLGGDNTELYLKYTAAGGGAVPEPAALGLIGIVLLALRKRRSF